MMGRMFTKGTFQWGLFQGSNYKKFYLHIFIVWCCYLGLSKTAFFILALSLFFRHYRPAHVETPSHTGGISKEARDRLVERMQKSKSRSVLHASSKDKEQGKERDYDEKNSDRHRHSRGKERCSHDRGKEGGVCFAGFNA